MGNFIETFDKTGKKILINLDQIAAIEEKRNETIITLASGKEIISDEWYWNIMDTIKRKRA